jgi:hypothetical protein
MLVVILVLWFQVLLRQDHSVLALEWGGCSCSAPMVVALLCSPTLSSCRDIILFHVHVIGPGRKICLRHILD